jgi:hypothetical protein
VISTVGAVEKEEAVSPCQQGLLNLLKYRAQMVFSLESGGACVKKMPFPLKKPF